MSLSFTIIHWQPPDVGIIAIHDGLKCENDNSLAVIESIALNEDQKVLFVFVIELSQWVRLPRNLVEIGANAECLVVFAAKLAYRHGPSSVFAKSADERGDRVTLYTLHIVGLLRGRFVGDLHRFGSVGTSFTDASQDRSF